MACAVALGSSALGNALFRDTFNYPDGLITNERAFWNPEDPDSIRSLIWEMTSGSFFSTKGAAWTGFPNDRAPNFNSSTGNNSCVFRLTTIKNDFGNVAVTVAVLNHGLTNSPTTPAVAWDGGHIFLRYQNEYNLYYASFNRRDGKVVIKKQTPGGPSNGGTYYDLSPYVTYAVPSFEWQIITATIQTNPDGSVTIRLYANHKLLVSATDNGTIGGPPITVPGKVGIRADNAEFKFEDFTVTALPPGSRPDTTPAITNLTAVAINQSTLQLEWPVFNSGTAHFFYANAFSVSSSSSSLPVALTNLVVVGGKVHAQISDLQRNTRYNIVVYHSTDLASWSLASNVAVAQTSSN